MIKNRKEAGKKLALKISDITNHDKIIVLAIPKGGVIVGYEIAKQIGAKLDVIFSKKITPPGTPEFAIGAITIDGVIYQGPHWDRFSIEKNFQQEIDLKSQEVQRQIKKFRKNSSYKFENESVILADDGIATGATVLAILKWLNSKKIKRIILAVPVAPLDTINLIEKKVDVLFSLESPKEFSSVGQFYEEFDQVSDDEVLEILGSK